MTVSEYRPRAFIGGTVADLPLHRAAVIEACERVGFAPMFDESFAANDTALEAVMKLVDEANVYIGILGFRYGYVPPGQEKSIAEIEFERARARGIPCLLFLMSDHHPVRAVDVDVGSGALKLEEFKSSVRRQLIVSEFSSPDELKANVVTALVAQMQSRRSEPITALLLLPREAAYEKLKTFLSDELQNHGVRVLQLDEMIPSGAMWANAISEAIQTTDLVVVDITNANSNLMYELGYVHALKKPTILLINSTSARRLPSDLEGFQYFAYDPKEFDVLRKPFERLLRGYLKEAAR
jgi:hypothetical protein